MKADSLKAAERLQPFTKVILKTGQAGSSAEYVSGDDTGRALTVEIPFASQEIADSILADVRGYAYQPFSASGAVIDPAVELGDTLEIGGITEKMYAQDITFGAIKSSNVSAPGEEEIDHEFTFVPARDRKVNRTLGGHAKAIKEQGEKLVLVDSGLNQIATYDPENDNWGLAEAKVFASITDGEGEAKQFKEAFMKVAVDRDAQGNMRSLAQVVGDVIELRGQVYIRDGSLWSDGGVVAKSLIQGTQFVLTSDTPMVLSNHGSIRVSGHLSIYGTASIGVNTFTVCGHTFEPVTTTIDGQTVWVLAERPL